MPSSLCTQGFAARAHGFSCRFALLLGYSGTVITCYSPTVVPVIVILHNAALLLKEYSKASVVLLVAIRHSQNHVYISKTAIKQLMRRFCRRAVRHREGASRFCYVVVLIAGLH